MGLYLFPALPYPGLAALSYGMKSFQHLSKKNLSDSFDSTVSFRNNFELIQNSRALKYYSVNEIRKIVENTERSFSNDLLRTWFYLNWRENHFERQEDKIRELTKSENISILKGNILEILKCPDYVEDMLTTTDAFFFMRLISATTWNEDEVVVIVNALVQKLVDGQNLNYLVELQLLDLLSIIPMSKIERFARFFADVLPIKIQNILTHWGSTTSVFDIKHTLQPKHCSFLAYALPSLLQHPQIGPLICQGYENQLMELLLSNEINWPAKLIFDVRKILIEKGKPEQANRLKNWITQAYMNGQLDEYLKNFENALSFDLEFIPFYKMLERLNGPQNLLTKRIKEIFESKNSSYLDHALHKLLSDNSIAHYILNARKEELAKRISIKALDWKKQLQLLPLLPPSEMVHVINQIPQETQLTHCLQMFHVPYIAAPLSIAQLMVSIFNQWIPQANSSSGSSSYYAQQISTIFRILSFVSLAIAAKNDHLQNKVLATLVHLGNVQQSIVIPQIPPKAFVNYLKKITFVQQTAFLSMATCEQKIVYLSMMQTNDPLSKEITKIGNFKAQIKQLVNDAPLAGKTYNDLKNNIMAKIGALKFVIEKERTSLNKLLKSLNEPLEISVLLSKIIEEKIPPLFKIIDDLNAEINQLQEDIESFGKELGLDPAEVPQEFYCPISQEIMENPVEASDKKIYDLTSIQEWMKRSRKSPITREILTDTFIARPDLKNKILEWQKETEPSST